MRGIRPSNTKSVGDAPSACIRPSAATRSMCKGSIACLWFFEIEARTFTNGFSASRCKSRHSSCRSSPRRRPVKPPSNRRHRESRTPQRASEAHPSRTPDVPASGFPGSPPFERSEADWTRCAVQATSTARKSPCDTRSASLRPGLPRPPRFKRLRRYVLHRWTTRIHGPAAAVSSRSCFTYRSSLPTDRRV